MRKELPVARIDVLTDRPIGTVDRRIFGSFTVLEVQLA